MTSFVRTVVIPAAPVASNRIYAPIQGLPALWWPVAEPNENLDYYADATAPLAEENDTLFSVSLAISPSGSGELAAANLSANGDIIQVWLSGGVPGRAYVVMIDATCVSGRVFEWLIGIIVDPLLQSFPVPTAPNPGFGTAITWYNQAPADALLGADGDPLLGADGDYLTYA